MTNPIPEREPANPLSPIRFAPHESEADQPQEGIALCLSGGGYRAMLFHLGALWRLNELGYLPKLARISSVSGGSITSGALAMNWGRLAFDPTTGVAAAFVPAVVDPIRSVAGHTIDAPSVIEGVLLRGTVADHVAGEYRRLIFGETMLQDLPETPLFVFNATNLQSGVLWRFTKPFAWDWRVGKIANPVIPLAVAVASSSAFPPVLSPMHLRFKDTDFVPGTGADLQRPPYTTDVFLADGGVYDNLGLETAWKEYTTILVSNGGIGSLPEERPHTDWARQALRVIDLIQNQVRSLRTRQVLSSFEEGHRRGAYWGIQTDIAAYHLPDALPASFASTTLLAEVATRLERIEPARQERLINWGYAVCDAGLRRHFGAPNHPAAAFPYAGGVG